MKINKQLLGILTVTASLAMQAHAQDFLTNGLVAYYPFNGNANDASGNGNNGQLTAGTFISDRFGNPQGALEVTNVPYAGSVAAVLTTIQQTPGNVFTLSAWFKATSQSDGQIISFGDGQNGHDFNADRNLIITSSGHVVFYVYPGYQVWIEATNNVTYGQWHSAVATLSGAGMRLYLDGVLVTNNPSVTTAQSYSGYWHMARTFGDIDDARIYNRALSDSEVQQLYAYESAPSFTNHFYQWVSGPLRTWHQAKADAESRGGHLATITSEAEWNFIVSLGVLPNPLPDAYWLGGTDEGHEGAWTWITGEPWVYSRWLAGEPNNQGGNENYLTGGAWLSTFWNDSADAGRLNYYLLEYEHVPPSVGLLKAVKPSFSNLTLTTNYQLQVSGDLNNWTNHGAPFTATNTSMVSPQYWDVDNWGSLFFRVQIVP